VKITCPKCSKETTFNVTEAISCSQCKTSFHGLKLTKKAMITAWTALAIGGYAGHKIDDLLEPNRYPTMIEFALLESCAKGGKEMGFQRIVSKRLGMCACILEETQKTIDFKRYQAEPSEFWTTMRTKTQSCLTN
jgi:hypothetical protein